MTLGIKPSSDYWDGRFSNGKVWAEHIGPLLGYETENLATGGATTNNDYLSFVSFLGIHIPSSQDRINGVKDLLVDGMFPAGGQNVAYHEMGCNDLFSVAADLDSGDLSIANFTSTLSDIVTEQIEQLVKMRYRYVIAVNMPAIYKTPAAIDEGVVEIGLELIPQYNQLLAAKTARLRDRAAGAVFGILDAEMLVRVSVSSPTILHVLGITNTTGACLDTFDDNTGSSSETADPRRACLDKDQFYFMDGTHPNRVIHRVFGYYAYEHIRALDRGSSFDPTEQNLLWLIRRYSLDAPFDT
ncbi:hypothetical protein GGF46_002597 [Coemansia sp. RSA 552]|nr:hypothetical protein GGF46_002597 [Coemansia sp. RSA 552]